MNAACPLLLTMILGWLSFELIFRKSPWGFLDLCVAFIFGMGLSVELAFYQIFFWNTFDPGKLIIIHFLLIGLMACIRTLSVRPSYIVFPRSNLTIVPFVLCFLLFMYLVYHCSLNNLYGDWDAWAFWNFHAKQIFTSGINWKDMYTYSFNVKHPCFLSYWIVWQWSWTGMTLNVPMGDTDLFFMLAVSILVYGLIEWTDNVKASFLAGIFLCSIPLFLVHSVSQYADILFVIFSLTTMLMLLRMFKNPVKSSIVWTCALLGFMTLVKDEAIVASLILMGFVLIFLNRRSRSSFILAAAVFLLASMPTIMTKHWLMGTYQGQINQMEVKYLFEPDRYATILKYYGGIFLKNTWGGIFIIPAWIFFQGMMGQLDEKAKFWAKFLALFCTVFFLLYGALKYQLDWRLATTADRMIYEVLPAFIFLIFYILFRKMGKE